MTTSPNPCRCFQYPAEVIQHAVWLYHCFSLSLQDVELILAARGIVVNYESIREWGLRFGRMFANALKRRRPRRGDKWYMDEVFIRIRGKQHLLWRAVDQDGVVLDVLVQSRRSAKAAKLFFRIPVGAEQGLRPEPVLGIADQHPADWHDGHSTMAPYGGRGGDLDEALALTIPTRNHQGLPACL
jgi:hypothetical protein